MGNLKKVIERAERSRSIILDFISGDMTIKDIASKHSVSVNSASETIDTANFFMSKDGLITKSTNEPYKGETPPKTVPARDTARSIRALNSGVTKKLYKDRMTKRANGIVENAMTLARNEKGGEVFISEDDDGMFCISIGSERVKIDKSEIKRAINKLNTCLS